MASFERISKRAVLVGGVFAVFLLTLVDVPDARAGRFHVYSCRTPAGEIAPVDGWSGSVAAGSAVDVYARNTCGTSGGLLVALGDQTTHLANTDKATWTFAMPATGQLVAATLWRSGYLHSRSGEGASYQFWLAGPAPQAVFDTCTYSNYCSQLGNASVPLSATNRVQVPVTNLGSHLYVNASCGASLPENECGHGFGDPNGYAAAVYLYAADLLIEQNAGPSAGGVSGELASAPAVAGTSDVAFTASDPGSGVYEAVFSVDGQPVQSTVIDENGGRCRNVGQTSDGSPAFLYLQPCLGSVSADVGLDTTRIANGSHHLRVDVLDAAGNAAPVLDRQITIANPTSTIPGPPNGVNASSTPTLAVGWRSTRRASLTSGYGRRQTVIGRLTALGGTPISGAQIELAAQPTSTGSRPIALPGARTGADGRFAVRLPAGLPSCALRVTYRAHIGDALPAASRTLRLNVHAGIALRITPRTASVGQSIQFQGHLLGRPVPHDGKQLVLEARSPGGAWIEFEVVRTDARGRYRASYRFKFPGPADYQFRVLSEPESDYPYAAGASRAVGVHER